jgi:hypothetical protein
MKKILIAFCLFFTISCAATSSTNTEKKTSPMDRVGQALEKITLPKF